jgi:hypothetical protein
MVHFPGFARTRLCIYRAVIRFCRIGFPHSEIPGSMPTCGSPRLIAACHVLHRLLLPRHPPCALSSLTTKFTQLTSALRRSMPANFMMHFSICSSLPTVIADRGAPAESKALIKHTHFNSRLVVFFYPMLFSCQKSFADKGVPPEQEASAFSRKVSDCHRPTTGNRILIAGSLVYWWS